MALFKGTISSHCGQDYNVCMGLTTGNVTLTVATRPCLTTYHTVWTGTADLWVDPFKTLDEFQQLLQHAMPKSSLSAWFSNVRDFLGKKSECVPVLLWSTSGIWCRNVPVQTCPYKINITNLSPIFLCYGKQAHRQAGRSSDVSLASFCPVLCFAKQVASGAWWTEAKATWLYKHG